MPEVNDLQNQVNTILGPKAEPQPQVTPIPNISTQPILRPVVDSNQQSPLVPPIQSQESYVPAEGRIFEEKKSANYTKLILATVVLVVGSVAVYFSRGTVKTIVGPLSYADCLEIEGSKKINLEPKYCTTPEGETFFENENNLPETASDIIPTQEEFLLPTSNPP